MTRLLTVREASRARGFPADLFADIEASCRDWRARGAHVLTAPLDRGVRCSMRDPDGYFIEVGHATGLVEGRFAERAPEGRETGRANGR